MPIMVGHIIIGITTTGTTTDQQEARSIAPGLSLSVA